MMSNNKTYYEILEVDSSATFQEIERAYLEAKETYSPASAALYSIFSKEEALELHKLIETAYTTLSNHELRKKYDSSLEKNPSLKVKTSKPKEPAFNQEAFLKSGKIIKEHSEDQSLDDKITSLSDCSGSFLQKVRKYKNISLEELSQFSKISKTNILAVEEEDFANLPAKVFIRGFVMQIAKLLGLDEKKFADGYIKIFDEYKSKQ